MSNMVILRGPQGVRLVNCGEPYRLQPDEQIVGSASLVDAAKNTEAQKRQQAILDDAQLTIGAGDLIAAVTGSIGFKKWWDEKHGGSCLPCKRKQAVANYLRLKGPAWLMRWVRENADS